MPMLVGLAFVGCSNEDVISSDNGLEKAEGHFMAVEIFNPATITRAGGDQTQDTEDPKGTYEEGYAEENAITKLRFYFFDQVGNPVDVNSDVNYKESEKIESAGVDMPNVEKKLKAIVVINPENKSNVKGMVVVANPDKAATQLGTNSLSLTELREKVGDYNITMATGKPETFVLTSSSYANENGQINMAEVTSENLCSSESAALLNPVKVYIERLVAKVKLSVNYEKIGTDIGTVKDVTMGGQTYKAIPLKDKKGADGSNITADEKQVYVIFNAWDVTGTADKSYLFKKVNSSTNWNGLGWTWNHPGFFRSYWAMNPAGLTLKYYTYNSIGKKIGTPGTSDNYYDYVAYCLENAADNYTDGTKSGYNPDDAKSNRTQAIIKATLVTVGDDNVATPLELARWANEDYTVEDVKTAMINTVTTDIYKENPEYQDGTAGTEKFISIAPEDVVLVRAEDAGMADGDSENSKRYLSYLQLPKTSTTQFYSAAIKTATTEEQINSAKLTNDAVNGKLKDILGAKVWDNGAAYYYTDIQHLGTAADKGLYGVVRNHIYDIKINSVYGLGTPVYDPDGETPIIPQKPKEDDTYIAAQIHILSWRVVNNDVDLEW